MTVFECTHTNLFIYFLINKLFVYTTRKCFVFFIIELISAKVILSVDEIYFIYVANGNICLSMR